MADGSGKNRITRDKAMAAHLRKIGYPHGRRMSAPHWPFDLHQVGSNKYVRYIARKRKAQ
jgi:hypothetical protein